MFLILTRILNSKTTWRTLMFYCGSFLINLGNYGFHFLLLKMITPAEYGEFSSYLSLLYLLTIPSTALSMMVTKEVSDTKTSSQKDSLNSLFYYLTNKIIIFSLITGIVLVIASDLISVLIKVEKHAIIVLAFSIGVTMTSAIISSFLIGQQKLKIFVMVGIVTVILKMTIAYLFILSGIRVLGAVSSILGATILGTGLSLIFIWKIIFPKKNVKTNFNFKQIGLTSLIYSSASLSLISTDILLVRYFFDEKSSGIYAAIVTLSKTIHFGLMPLTLLVIPMITTKFIAGEKTKSLILGLVGMALTLGTIGIVIFASFTKQLIILMSGKEYLPGAVLLIPALISILIFTINLLLINYFIAISRHKIIYGLMVAMIAQPILIGIFHTTLVSVYAINIGLQIILSVWIGVFGLLGKSGKP